MVMDKTPILEQMADSIPSDAFAKPVSNPPESETAGPTTTDAASETQDGQKPSTHGPTRKKKKTTAELLPPEFQPKPLTAAAQVEVPVESFGRREYSPEEIERLRGTLGMIDVKSKTIVALRGLGDQAEALGIGRTIKGATLLQQNVLSDTLIHLHNILHDTTGKYTEEEKMEASKVQPAVSTALRMVNKSAVDMDATVAQTAIAVDKYKRPSFPNQRVLTPRPIQLPKREPVEG